MHASMHASMHAKGQLSEAASDLIASMERNGLPGAAIDRGGFVNLEAPRRATDSAADVVEGNKPCQKLGDVLGCIRRGRSFYAHASRPSRLPELAGHGLAGRVLIDAGPMASATRPAAPAMPQVTHLC